MLALGLSGFVLYDWDGHLTVFLSIYSSWWEVIPGIKYKAFFWQNSINRSPLSFRSPKAKSTLFVTITLADIGRNCDTDGLMLLSTTIDVRVVYSWLQIIR